MARVVHVGEMEDGDVGLIVGWAGDSRETYLGRVVQRINRDLRAIGEPWMHGWTHIFPMAENDFSEDCRVRVFDSLEELGGYLRGPRPAGPQSLGQRIRQVLGSGRGFTFQNEIALTCYFPELYHELTAPRAEYDPTSATYSIADGLEDAVIRQIRDTVKDRAVATFNEVDAARPLSLTVYVYSMRLDGGSYRDFLIHITSDPDGDDAWVACVSYVVGGEDPEPSLPKKGVNAREKSIWDRPRRISL